MSEGSIRERLSMLSRRELVGLAIVVAVTLAAGGLWYVRSLPKPVEVASAPGSSQSAFGSPVPGVSGATGAEVGPSATPGVSLFVHVAGWVRKPGVYEFHEGDRVIDALQAAGGERRGASLDGLNLAAPLTDGSQILVPERQRASAVPVPGTSPGAVPGDESIVNVNTADATQLETLPGIGEVLAQTIIDHRTENGPFASVDDLEDVSGIGPATLEEIRDLVQV